MNEIARQISQIGIMPVIKLTYPDRDALPLADALCAGGIPAAEITFRAEGAERAVALISRAHPEMLIGAGTVLTEAQVDAAVAAGARFIVTPGLDAQLVRYCQSIDIPIFPGCTTATDYHAAFRLGLEVLKFFPAEQAGGLAMIKAMAAPYTNVKFMPTGGISAKNLEEYLSFGKIAACGGSWMVKADLVDNKEYDKIEEMTREAVELVKKIRG